MDEPPANIPHNFDRSITLHAGARVLSMGFSEIVKSILLQGYGGMSASSLAMERASANIYNLTRFWYNTVFFSGEYTAALKLIAFYSVYLS